MIHSLKIVKLKMIGSESYTFSKFNNEIVVVIEENHGHHKLKIYSVTFSFLYDDRTIIRTMFKHCSYGNR
jgi:hypothetical protein